MNIKIHTIWFFVIPVLCLLGYGYYFVNKKNYVSPVSYVVKDGKLTQAMKDLLKLSYIEYDGTFQDAVLATQKHWHRPLGSKRWEMDDTTYANRKEIWDAFEKLHIVQRVEPLDNRFFLDRYNYYSEMFILGDAYDGIKSKMQYIQLLYERAAVRCGQLIFLTSDRKLDQAYEIEAMMQDFEITAELCPKTESDMIKFVAEKMIPSGLGDYLEDEYIVVPCTQENPQPNTKDMVLAWLDKTSYGYGKCLVISAQPYIAYQHSVFTTYMPKGFTIQTVGPATIEFMYTGVYFDTLARILDQENIRMNIK